jgi:hypothetical protein
MRMRVSARILLVVGLVLSGPLLASSQEELFRCKQKDGTIAFSDHGGPGCRKGEFKGDIQVLERDATPRTPATTPPAASRSAEAVPIPVPARPERTLSAQPFSSVTRSVPSLAVRDLPPQFKARGMSIPNKGDITMVQLAVSHLPAGNGPRFSADAHFQGDARAALDAAARAAAKAVQYDSRYLQVVLTLPVGFTLLQGVQVDGPSAGVAWTVAIVSAILGDPLRSDVCLSGTMGLDLKVGWVGGLEHKIEGCHMMREFRELLLPAGQNSFTITDKGMARSIKVTEVATLAEAYQIATGRELRAFQ